MYEDNEFVKNLYIKCKVVDNIIPKIIYENTRVIFYFRSRKMLF